MQEKIKNAFEWRAAIKSFDKEKKVEESLVNSIIEAGRMSATAYGLQPFRLIEVKDATLRAQIKDAAYDQAQTVEASHLFALTASTNVDATYVRKYIENIAETRGVSIDSLKGYEDMMLGMCSMSDSEKSAWVGKQAYIALGAMLETAALLEVDAGPMEGFDKTKVDEILNLKEMHLSSIAFLCLGYRSDEDLYSKMKKVRLAINDFLIIK